MILEFSVENYRSFRDKQTFSMLPDEGKTEYSDNIFTLSDKYKFLTSAVIYGANASGKSNFMRALGALRNLILTGGNTTPGQSLEDYEPFKLHTETMFHPTVFEIDFLIKGVRYSYLIASHGIRIFEEKLLLFPEGKEAKLFHRNLQEFSFGDYLKGQKSVVKNLTSENQVFLSKAAVNNIQQLKDIYLYFAQDFMSIPFLDSWIDSYYSNRIAQELLKKSQNELYIKNFKSLVKSFDTGILDFKIKKNYGSDSFRDKYEILTSRNIFSKKNNGGYEQFGESFQPIHEESTGTQKLFVLGGLVLRAIMNGRTIMIDEFERSLHPKITKFLIDIFHNPEINKKGAQLIIATHDTNLLSSNEFRRDQIWIVEKDQQGASELFSLADATGILKNANYEKWYLSGKFGGLPGIESLNFELNFKHETEKSKIEEV